MIDPFGRHISYLRVSVTDRCDFRCVYCMSEHMTFLPKADVLTLEETRAAVRAPSCAKGVERIRITGGEPLVRRNVMSLFDRLGARASASGLEGTDADDQRQPACAFCARSARCGRQADQCLARHARCGEIPRHHPLGRAVQGAWRHRCGAGRRPRRQDQHGRAEGRQRGRDRRSCSNGRMGAAWT